jgi:ribosome-associated protein
MIEIKDDIFICEDELVFRASRSGGPGGQNVNKVSTRVTLFFNVAGARSFSDEQKTQILRQLGRRVGKEGVVRVVSQRYRTQNANRKVAVERLRELLRGALETRPVRKKTRAPQWAKQRRLGEKRRRSALKSQRGHRTLAEDFAD